MIPVQYFFVLSALLFFIGVYGFCTRRNLVAMLIYRNYHSDQVNSIENMKF